jgi:hypothetical protein
VVTSASPSVNGTTRQPEEDPMRRFMALFSALMLVGLLFAAGPGPSVVRAAVPSDSQRVVYQRVCEAAEGTLSDQAALVCTHSDFPQWRDKELDRLERVCERALGGTYVYRSEFPTELAACFFD